jgi:hypothetical protein
MLQDAVENLLKTLEKMFVTELKTILKRKFNPWTQNAKSDGKKADVFCCPSS